MNGPAGAPTRAAGAAVSGICLWLVTACATAPLFRPDRGVRILTPRFLSVVSAPVEVSWRANAVPTRASRYVVFIDRPPIHPGQDLRAVANGDVSCLHTPGCPDASYLRAHDVFLTGGTSVTIPYIARMKGREGRDRYPIHEATVIFVDTQGRRVGEFAYTVQFRVSGEQ